MRWPMRKLFNPKFKTPKTNRVLLLDFILANIQRF